jgi:hypothetical protein
MSDKAVYGSKAWVALLGGLARRLLAEAGSPRSRFTLIERLLNAPADGQPAPPLEAGYRLDIAAGEARVRFGVGPDEVADAWVDVDYPTGVRLCALTSGAALDALSAEAKEKGLIVVRGDVAASPIDLTALHDAIVPLTR